MTIMKKQYISPEFFIQDVELQNFVCGSVGVSGDTGITKGGTEETPTQGDSRRKNIWDEEEFDDEEQW